MSDVRVLLTTFGFPLYQHSFLEDHVVALAGLGADVCVVSNAPGDHRLRDGSGRKVHVVRAPFGDAPARKLLTLAGVLRAAATHNRGELRGLVAAVGRGHGWRHLPHRLYSMAPVLAWDADVVHLGWLSTATRWTALLESVERPVVVSSHGSDLRLEPLADDDYRRRLETVFERVDLVHCVSHDLAERAESFGLDPAKVFVGGWGIDTRYFRPPDDQAEPRGVLRVVSVGRIHWVKAYECALQALGHVRRAGVEIDYTIVGEADTRARVAVLAAVEDLGLQGRVHVRGLATRDEVRATLRSADVFLLTSVSEGLSTATLEAMAVGLPVVVTDVGGMREAVDDGVTGYVVPPRDPGGVADALVAVARDPARGRTMGCAGRRRVVDDFDTSVRAPEALAQYRRLAGR